MAKFEVIGSGVSYMVAGPDGTKVGGPYYNHDQAENAREEFERRAKIKERPCMTCGDLFMSEGAHNRMCDPCRKDTDVFEGAV